MRPIPTTKSTTTSDSSLSPMTSPALHSTWHSPVPYLFGGLAAMLGLIAFALLILACSYWKLSVQHDDEETGNNRNRNRNVEEKEQSDSGNKETVKVYEEKILVIMAGDDKPTFLATPACANCSSFADGGAGKHSDNEIKNPDETLDKSEKEVMDRALQATTLLSTQHPQPPQEQS